MKTGDKRYEIKYDQLICVFTFAVCIILDSFSKYRLFAYLAAAVLVIKIIISCNIENFYFSFFLIPNIRILDNTNIFFLVNLLMVFPLIKYAYTEKFKIEKEILFDTITLLIIEGGHIIVLKNYRNIPSEIAWLLSFFLCRWMTMDKDACLEKRKVMWYLSLGILFSSVVYLVCHPLYTQNLISNILDGNRFKAYADDPNFYSLYICLAMAMLLSIRKKHKIYYLILILMTAIGVLTVSKMCILLMTFILFSSGVFQLMRKKISKKDFAFWNQIIVSFVVLMYVFYDLIVKFASYLLRRAGISGGNISIATITTGRSVIFWNYVKILKSDLILLLWGNGFQYMDYLNEPTGHGAHNTYLEFILAWGIIGTVVFIYIVMHWVKKYAHFFCLGIQINEWMPMMALAFSYLALGCLNATMFWWTLTAAVISLKRDDIKR